MITKVLRKFEGVGGKVYRAGEVIDSSPFLWEKQLIAQRYLLVVADTPAGAIPLSVSAIPAASEIPAAVHAPIAAPVLTRGKAQALAAATIPRALVGK